MKCEICKRETDSDRIVEKSGYKICDKCSLRTRHIARLTLIKQATTIKIPEKLKVYFENLASMQRRETGANVMWTTLVREAIYQYLDEFWEEDEKEDDK